MKKINVIFVFIVLFTSFLNANPTSLNEAKTIVKVWLMLDPKPLKMSIGHQVKEVKAFTDDNGTNLYYVVYLNPSGFVIVPADDWIEPIICFADDGVFKPSLDNPLGALVINDLKTRMRNVRRLMEKTKDKKDFFPLPVRFSKAKEKWDFLRKFKKDKLSALGIQNISDVRVEPLIQSKWAQTNVNGKACYNYYTPPGPEGSSSNYPCGCVATAMAQLMRFYQHPTEGVGTPSFTIYVDGISQTRSLRGGDGSGGPYDWENMPLVPADSPITERERQAIGALCHDAGVSVNMEYTATGSGAWVRDAADSLVNTFGYSNAIKGYNSGYDIGSGLIGMLNPNLDAGFPVLLGITGSPGGHAVVCDGYGYELGTLYHHLNLGWSGTDDAWYNLPTIDTHLGAFTTIDECVYNIYVTGSGEIISGRVTDKYGNPIAGAVVIAERTGGGKYTATTNSKGIYAIAKIPSNSEYTLTVEKEGYTFDPKTVTVGTSTNYENSSGNLWGVNFEEHTECIHQNGNEYESISGNYTVSESYENGIWLQSSGTVQYRFFLPVNKYYSYLDARIFGKNRDPGYPALVEVFNWQTNSWDSLGRLYDGEGETRFLLDQTKYIDPDYGNLVVRIRCGAIYYNSYEIRDIEVHYTCEPKQWTFMVYLNGDNNLEEAAILDFNEMEKAANNPSINIVVQFDRINGYDNSNGNWTGTRRYHLRYDTDPINFANYTLGTNYWEIGEVNMGDPNTLREFINWAMENYPANHYALILWNHGSGALPKLKQLKVSSPKLVCVDDTEGDYLTIKELGGALKGLSLDIIGFDACLMGMIEVGYEIKDSSQIMIASEEWEGGNGWDYTILSHISQHSSVEKTAKILVNEDIVEPFPNSNNLFTISAFRLGNYIQQVAEKLSNLADKLKLLLTSQKERITEIRKNSQKFDFDGYEVNFKIEEKDIYVDLKNFAQEVLAEIPEARNEAEELIQAIENAIVKYVSEDVCHSAAYGISFYFPSRDNPAYIRNYNGSNFSFNAHYNWDEFLKTYLDIPPTNYIINVSAGPYGRVSPVGEVTVEEGNSITFSAFPEEGYQVNRWYWDGDVAQTGGTTFNTPPIYENHSLYVTFKEVSQYGVEITSPREGGIYYQGSRLYISWNYYPEMGTWLKIELLRNGSLVDTICEEVLASSRNYSYFISYSIESGEGYQIKITSTSTGAVGYSGTFTIKEPPPQGEIIEIRDINDLQSIASTGHYILVNDIDADGYHFEPLPGFRGILDGNNHKIINLNINKPTEDYVGLFRWIEDKGVVKNLIIDGGYIVGRRHVGAICGENNGKIINCHSTAEIRGNKDDPAGNIGGLVGLNVGVIRNCSCTGEGDIRGYSTNIGGIAGGNAGVIEFCWVSIHCIHGSDDGGDTVYNVGGIVGCNYERGVIRECYASGEEVDSDNYYAGGIAGMNEGTIKDCYSMTRVDGDIIGGLVGENDGGTVTNCYASGYIDDKEGGGLTGENINGTFTACLWDIQTTGKDKPAYVEGGNFIDCYGKTTEEMHQRTTYESLGWDFANVWTIEEGSGYPKLRGAKPCLPPPSSISATTNLTSGVEIKWEEVEGAGCYRVYRADSSNGYPQPVSEWISGTTFLDTSPIPNLTYYYWVTAAITNHGAGESDFSPCASGKRLPGPVSPPASITASDGQFYHVIVNWSVVPNAGFYKLYRSETEQGPKTPLTEWQPETEFVDTPPEAEKIYYYWVKTAVDENGAQESDFCGPETGYFVLPTYTIIATAGEGGSISPSGEVDVTHGDDQTFTITPDEWYHISDVIVDGTSIGAVSSYTFENVTQDHTIHAEFAPDDTDEDGLPDIWENEYFGTLNYGPDDDPDNDGLSNLEEYNLFANPANPDTDEDGLPDGWEVQYGLDPNDPTGDNGADGDPDNDGYTNLEEYQGGSDPQDGGSVPSTHFYPVAYTSTWVNFYGTVKIFGENAEPGDEVGAFIKVDGEEICIGAYKITEDDWLGGENVYKYGFMPVYGDDDTTPEKDGAAPGDRIIFKIWDASEQKEYVATTLGPDEPIWTHDGDQRNVNLDVVSAQIIPLHPGWNLISFSVNNCYYDSENPPDVPLLPGVNLISVDDLGDIFVDENGNSFVDRVIAVRGFDRYGAHTYVPGSPYSTLHYMASGYGYWIKISEGEDIKWKLEGARANPTDTLQLQEGWNLVGFWDSYNCYYDSENPPDVDLPPDVTNFTQVDDIGNIPVINPADSIIVIRSFDEKGAHTYVPGSPYSTLHYIAPGYGYWIKVREESTLSWPE